jgi:methylated-DNA-[protein]-cysteine S-methyltransferase
LTHVWLAGAPDIDAPLCETPILARAATQLAEYFAGTRRTFDLPLAAAGTAFQQRVWQVLTTIPFGATWSYGELARAIGNPAASRAVGAANGKNPIGIIVPCHRVIGSNGTLTGYAGGLDMKQALLAHERRLAPAAAVGGQLALI